MSETHADKQLDNKEKQPANESDAARSALSNDAQSFSNPRVRVVGERAEMLLSDRGKADGTLIGPTDPNKEITVTVMVKSKATDADFDRTIQNIVEHKQKPLTDAEFDAKFGADPDAMKRTLKFASDNGLKAEEADSSSGRVLLKGTVKDFSTAFGVKLNDYKTSTGAIERQREGTLSVPRGVGGDIDGVFGLDERVQAHTHNIRPTDPRAFGGGFLPTEVAKAYNFPKESMGGGQSAAILEFGGGLDLKDNAEYYKEHNFKLPEINVVGVDGADNVPGSDPQGADGEVALDSQIIGSVAPDAKQMLIFSKDTEQGWVDAITRATFTKPGETPNSVISISWGDPEARWTEDQRREQGLAFKKAALKGISIFAASGDDGAKDGSKDGRFTTDYPSSDPYVTGSGGTRISIDRDGKLKSEVTWNDGIFGGSGGGGISENMPLPDFQHGLKMPPNANNSGRPGRGVPDISADASPGSGYIVRTNGSEEAIGGTSAVSPLFAALTLRLNGALGHPVGYLNPFIYKHGTSGIFRDVTSGNNNGYNATVGWDAATGWGSPDGEKMLDALRKEGQ